MALYLIPNGAMPTTAALVKVTTAAVIKTLLQVKPGTTKALQIVEWGISFDGSAAATPGQVELIETDVAATVTASVANDIVKFDSEAIAGGDPTTNLILVGTTSTGYTASAEGATTASRLLDAPILLPPTQPFFKQYPLGLEPVIQVSKFARIRVTYGAAINAYCYMIVRV